jgi:hypothetical protein
MTETPQTDIEQLIKEEQDPKNRAILLVLSKIAASLVANTRLTENIDNRLQAHLQSYEARMVIDAENYNKALGGWKVIIWVLGVIQVIAFSLFTWLSAEIKDLHKTDSAMYEQIAKLVIAESKDHK